MSWKRRLKRNLLFALLAGVVITAIYWGSLYSNTFHGPAVMALGPANNFVEFHLDPPTSISHRYLYETLVVNILLYTFLIFVLLTGIDVVRQLVRKFMR